VNSIIGVGFCDEKAPLNRMLGWDQGSWGYHGDDGCLFTDSGIGRLYGDTYSTGNVIGCGINFTTGTAFYTKDGTIIGQSSPPNPLASLTLTLNHWLLHVGRAFQDVKGKLYPAVCFDTGSTGCRVSVNFRGDDHNPFLFKGPYDAPETLEPPTYKST
jgi:hypothetical protein